MDCNRKGDYRAGDSKCLMLCSIILLLQWEDIIWIKGHKHWRQTGSLYPFNLCFLNHFLVIKGHKPNNYYKNGNI